METNRTLEILRMYNFTEKNHWQLMCDLSNNDYDISYFGGRESINYAFDELLQVQIDEGFNIEELLNNLQAWHDDAVNRQNEFYKENDCFNESYIGEMDEIQLLMKIIRQSY